jgi:hypothetical protein
VPISLTVCHHFLIFPKTNISRIWRIGRDDNELPIPQLGAREVHRVTSVSSSSLAGVVRYVVTVTLSAWQSVNLAFPEIDDRAAITAYGRPDAPAPPVPSNFPALTPPRKACQVPGRN